MTVSPSLSTVTGTRPRVAAFDVDGTLTRRDCVVPFLRRVAGLPRLVVGIARHPLRLARATLRRDRDALKALATRAAFAGRRAVDVAATARPFGARVYEDNMRDDTVALLREHLAAGDVVVLVSASYEVYLQPLARLLGDVDVIGTRLAVADGTLTGELDGPNCRAGEKVRRLDRWLGGHGWVRADVHLTAYGDSTGDRELLLDADVAHWMGAGDPPGWMPRT